MPVADGKGGPTIYTGNRRVATARCPNDIRATVPVKADAYQPRAVVVFLACI